MHGYSNWKHTPAKIAVTVPLGLTTNMTVRQASAQLNSMCRYLAKGDVVQPRLQHAFSDGRAIDFRRSSRSMKPRKQRRRKKTISEACAIKSGARKRMRGCCGPLNYYRQKLRDARAVSIDRQEESLVPAESPRGCGFQTSTRKLQSVLRHKQLGPLSVYAAADNRLVY